MLPKARWLISILSVSALGDSLKPRGTSHLNPNAIQLLSERGIGSDRLNEKSLGLRHGDGCFCSLACDTLTDIFGSGSVDIIGGEAYEAARSRFWSQQQSQETSPSCFFYPNDAEDVSIAILLSRATECPFAAKGGGHTAFKGSSNSPGGITIDFTRMKEVIPSADRKSVAVGPGNTWFDVYSTLDSFNLTVAGGRTATVGVSGLTLGGGISFFSGQHGWTCDNVISYEVVLGSGEIVTVDLNTNADLFWALRGGGGNFGIITQFVFHAFEQGPMWGGFQFWEMHSTLTPLIDAMINYAEKGSVEDPKAALIVSFAYAQAYQMWVSSVMTHYPEPQPPGSHPEVFDEFFKVENAFHDSTRTESHSNHTVEVASNSPSGMRQSYWTFTHRVDRQLTLDILTIYQEEVVPILNLTGMMPPFVYQVITVSQLKAMRRNGGNALGLSGGDEPLLLIDLAPMWVLASDDEAVLTAFSNIVSRSQKLAEERGLDHPYLYMNYASQFQDPLTSYGQENKAKLLEVSKKYDPEGIFLNLNPGYFKFEGAPVQW
ncbi:FAD-binding domain-containing protein [Hypoxylon crocopeplum]|nr:FAD-binding domain-containing protein [Hypoxylon crocopeplum]